MTLIDITIKMGGKRFLETETNIFLDILKKFKDVIENKVTNKVYPAEKQAAWYQVAAEFNKHPQITNQVKNYFRFL